MVYHLEHLKALMALIFLVHHSLSISEISANRLMTLQHHDDVTYKFRDYFVLMNFNEGGPQLPKQQLLVTIWDCMMNGTLDLPDFLHAFPNLKPYVYNVNYSDCVSNHS